MMRRVAALCAAGVLVGAATAHAELISMDTDSGLVPIATAEGWTDRAPWLEIKAMPSAPVETHADVQCSRGRRNAAVTTALAVKTPPFRIRIKLTIADPGRCYISVDASYQAFGEFEGSITATLRGHRR